MTTYKVSVKFVNDESAIIIWTLNSTAEMMLMERVEKMLQDWRGAKGLQVKQVNDGLYDMMLVHIQLGTIEIERVVPFIGKNFNGIEG